MENGIPQFRRNSKNFLENPSLLGEYAVQVKQIILELGCRILSEMVDVEADEDYIALQFHEKTGNEERV